MCMELFQFQRIQNGAKGHIFILEVSEGLFSFSKDYYFTGIIRGHLTITIRLRVMNNQT